MFKNKKIHLIGIGGVSMSGIATLLHNMGAIVSGSDSNSSNLTTKLINMGITLTIGTDISKLNDIDIVVYTASINIDNEELVYARKNGIQIYERPVFLGILSKEYKNCLCISGTHGKSTTTGLISHVFLEADLNPTISIGAELPVINGNIKIGSKDFLILEACEYVESFLHLFPTSAIITNVDADHLDYYTDINHIKNSFKKYSNLIPSSGYLVVNADDENSLILKDNECNVLTYGINSGDYRARNISYNNLGLPTYDIYLKDEYLTTINLNIIGNHNIYNSLAVFCLSSMYILDINTIKKGIESYRGVGRRFEFIGKKDNILIYDDYAHHPTEIETTINALEKVKHNNTFAIFQSHTYSRTYELLDEFALVLSKFKNVIIAPIYAARETNTYGIDEITLVNLINHNGGKAIFKKDDEDIISYLNEFAKDDDMVITIGAGPINNVGLKFRDK